MTLLSIVPLLCFLFIYGIYFQNSREEHHLKWRKAFLYASITWGVLVTGFAEFLSAFRLLTFGWLLALWGFTTLATCSYLVFVKRLFQPSIPEFNFHYSLISIGLLAGIALIVTTVGVIALVAPPNTWDSMTYHMSRVEHWIQNHSVEFYPTHISRQLSLNPWAEYAILNLQVLSGGDRLANLVQWFSMLGSIVGVTLIAHQLGADFRGEVFAAVLAATIPEGILEASSTQTDYVLSFFLVCLVYYLVEFTKKANWANSMGIGCSLGLAILTKATAYIYATPFLLWLLLSALRKSPIKSLQLGLVIGLIVVSLNIRYNARNFELFGSPLGRSKETSSAGTFKYTNDVYSAPAVTSNILRNLALHAGATPFDWFNHTVEGATRAIHRQMRVDVNDPRTTWKGTSFHVAGISTHEDHTGNFLHIVVGMLVTIALLGWRDLPGRKYMLAYLGTIVGGFLLFSLLLKWQPWHTRLHLPIFVLFTPLAGMVLAKLSQKQIVNTLVVLYLVASFYWLLNNSSRPILGVNSIFTTSRTKQYFVNRPYLEAPYLEATKLVTARACSQVGLYLGGNDWEYPFWKLLKEHNGAVRVEHINVSNVSAWKSMSLAADQFIPCAVISVRGNDDTKITIEHTHFEKLWSSGNVGVLFPRGS